MVSPAACTVVFTHPPAAKNSASESNNTIPVIFATLFFILFPPDNKLLQISL
jgi:hypothetical protein